VRRWAALVIAGTVAAALAAGALGARQAQAVEVDSRFTDDDWSIHEPNINAIAEAGITVGCNPPQGDRYCPERPVTRGEMAAFLVRSFGYTDGLDDPFVDDDDSIFQADIEKLAAAGVTLGCNPPANDRYCPEDSISRAQMASFLSRALDLEPVAGGSFRDIAGNTHALFINAIAAEGITIGCNPPANDRFCPDAHVTRAQMASFLSRALDLTPIPSRLSLRPGSACDRGHETCTATLTIPAGRTFEVREGWYNVLPFAPGEEAAFTSAGTSFSVTLDGARLALTRIDASTSVLATREWTTTITGIAAGTHVLRGVWSWAGTTNLTVVVTIEAR
jgi:hypothetical protein